MRLDKMRDRRLNRSIRQLARLYFLVENRPKQAAKLKAEWRMNVLLNSIRTQLRQRPKIYFHRKRNR